MRTPIRVGALFVAGTAAVTSLHAQTAMSAGRGASVDVARAEAIYTSAAMLFDKPMQYREAAGLLIMSARLREADDPRTFKTMWTAARLYSYARDHRNAQRTLQEAAELALDNGELVDAANAYVDAAMEAVERKDTKAVELIDRATRLAGSTHLAAAERDEILGRIGPVRIAFGKLER